MIDGEESGSGVTEDTYTVRAQEGALEQLQQGRFVYALERKVKGPGAYEMRIAVLDQVSGRVGSARRFIEVPDVRKGGLGSSAITMCDCDWRVRVRRHIQQAQLSPAIRIFRHDQPFSYGVTLDNPQLDPSTGQPAVNLQPRLTRGDQILWEGKTIPVISEPGQDPRRIVAGGFKYAGSQNASRRIPSRTRGNSNRRQQNCRIPVDRLQTTMSFYLARERATSISYRRLLAGSSQVEMRVDLSSATKLDPDVLYWCSAGFLVSGSTLLTLLTSIS